MYVYMIYIYEYGRVKGDRPGVTGCASVVVRGGGGEIIDENRRFEGSKEVGYTWTSSDDKTSAAHIRHDVYCYIFRRTVQLMPPGSRSSQYTRCRAAFFTAFVSSPWCFSPPPLRRAHARVRATVTANVVRNGGGLSPRWTRVQIKKNGQNNDIISEGYKHIVLVEYYRQRLLSVSTKKSNT